MLDLSVILPIFIILGVIFLIYFLFRKLKEMEERLKPSNEILEYLRETMSTVREANLRQDNMTKHIANSLNQQSESFVSILQKNTADMNQRLDKAAQVIGGVQKSLGEMSEVSRAMKELEQYLRSPKLRGNIGEQILGEVLSQMLPKDLYTMQYTFKSGEKVDAVIKISDNLIPVDAKFPIENFRKMNQQDTKKAGGQFKKEFIKDVKKHIRNISSKYILTAERTVDYGLMYIPSESIYYEVINNQELFDFCQEKRILVVSPMSFYAYLKAILMSFQGQTIQKKAKEILAILESSQKDYEKVEESLTILEKHFLNANNQLQNVNKHFVGLGQKIASSRLIQNSSSGIKELKE
jgi:DNA recombination protein RmuC